MAMAEHSSKVHPGLERKPGGPDNWVEATGGLPDYIERIAKHLHSDEGFPIDRAIATAVNTVKRWAAGGTVTAEGGPKVTAETQAKAAKALSQWNAMKARAHSLSGAEVQSRMDLVRRVVTAEGARFYGQAVGAVITKDAEDRAKAKAIAGVNSAGKNPDFSKLSPEELATLRERLLELLKVLRRDSPGSDRTRQVERTLQAIPQKGTKPDGFEPPADKDQPVVRRHTPLENQRARVARLANDGKVSEAVRARRALIAKLSAKTKKGGK